MRNLTNLLNFFYLALRVMRFFYFSTIFLFYINYKLSLLYLLEWKRRYGLRKFFLFHSSLILTKGQLFFFTLITNFFFNLYCFTSLYLVVLLKKFLTTYYKIVSVVFNSFKLIFVLFRRFSFAVFAFCFFLTSFFSNLRFVLKRELFYLKIFNFSSKLVYYVIVLIFIFFLFFTFYTNLDLPVLFLYMTKYLISLFVWFFKTILFYYNYFLLSWLNYPIENYFVWASHDFLEEVREAGEGEAWLKSMHAAGLAASIRYYVGYFFGSIIPILVFYYQVFELFFYHNFLQTQSVWHIFHGEPTILRLVFADVISLDGNMNFKAFWLDNFWLSGSPTTSIFFVNYYTSLPNFTMFLFDGGVFFPTVSGVYFNEFRGFQEFFFYLARFLLLCFSDTFLYFYLFFYHWALLAIFVKYLMWFALIFHNIFCGMLSGFLEVWVYFTDKFFICLFVFSDKFSTHFLPSLVTDCFTLLSLIFYKFFVGLSLLFEYFKLKVFTFFFSNVALLFFTICAFFLNFEFSILAVMYLPNIANLFNSIDFSFFLFFFRLIYRITVFIGSLYLSFVLFLFHFLVDFFLHILIYSLDFFITGLSYFILIILDLVVIIFDFLNVFDGFFAFSVLNFLKLRFADFVNILLPAFNYYSVFNLNFIPYYISVVLVLILIYNLRFLNGNFNPGRKHVFSLFFIRSLYFRSWFKDRTLLCRGSEGKLNFLYFNFENFLVAQNLATNLKLNYLSPADSILSDNVGGGVTSKFSSPLLSNDSIRIFKLSNLKRLMITLHKIFYCFESWIVSYLFRQTHVSSRMKFKTVWVEFSFILSDFAKLNLFLFLYSTLKFNFSSSFKSLFKDNLSFTSPPISFFNNLGPATTLLSTFFIFFISFADIFYWFGEKNIVELQLQERVTKFLFFSNTHPTASALFSDLFYDKMTFNTRFVGEFFDNTTFWLKFNHNFSTPRIFLYRYLKQIDKKLFPLQLDMNYLRPKRPWELDFSNLPVFSRHFSSSLNEKKRLALSLMRVSEFNYLMFEIFFLTYRDKEEDMPKIPSFKYWKEAYDKVIELLLIKRYFEFGDLIESDDYYTIFSNLLSDHLTTFTFQWFHNILFPFYKTWSAVEGKLESMFNHNQILHDYVINYVSPFNFFQKRPLLKKKKPLEAIEPNELFREWIDMNLLMYNFSAKAVRFRTPIPSVFRKQVRAKVYWDQMDRRYWKRVNIYRTFEEISSFPLVFTALDDDLHFRRIIDTFPITADLRHPRNYKYQGLQNRPPMFDRERDKHPYEEFGWSVETKTAFWSSGYGTRQRFHRRHKLHPITDYEFWVDPKNLYDDAWDRAYLFFCKFRDSYYDLIDTARDSSLAEVLGVQDFLPVPNRVHYLGGLKERSFRRHFFQERNFVPPLTRLNPLSPNYHYNIPLYGSNDVFRTPVSHLIFLDDAINTPFILQRHNIYMEILDFYKNYFGYPEFLTDNWVGTQSYLNESDRRFQDDNVYFQFNELDNPYLIKMLKTGKFHILKPWKKTYRPFSVAPKPKWFKWKKHSEYKELLNADNVPDWIPLSWKQIDWVRDLVQLMKHNRENFFREEDLQHLRAHLPLFWDEFRPINNRSVALNLDGTINALSHINFNRTFDSFFFDSMSKADNWILAIFSDLFISNMINLYFFTFRDFVYWFFSWFFYFRYQFLSPQFKDFYNNRYNFASFNEFDLQHSQRYWYKLFLADKFIFVITDLFNFGESVMSPEFIEKYRFALYNITYYGYSDYYLGDSVEGVLCLFDDEYYDLWDSFDELLGYNDFSASLFDPECEDSSYEYTSGDYHYFDAWRYGVYTDEPSLNFNMYELVFGDENYSSETFSSEVLEERGEVDFNISPSLVSILDLDYMHTANRLKWTDFERLLNSSDKSFIPELEFLQFLYKNNRAYASVNYDFLKSNKYDQFGYDEFGYDRSGYNRYGFDIFGYDRNGCDKDGYDCMGCDRYGYNRDGNPVFLHLFI